MSEPGDYNDLRRLLEAAGFHGLTDEEVRDVAPMVAHIMSPEQLTKRIQRVMETKMGFYRFECCGCGYQIWAPTIKPRTCPKCLGPFRLAKPGGWAGA